MTGARLSTALDPRANAFGFLRWLFAALVVVGHSVALGGFDLRIDVLAWWSDGRDSLGGLAVAGFFVISGFLVAQSWHRSSTSGRYLRRRVLRIFPGFWVCLLVTAFVFAPLAWQHEHGSLSGFIGSTPSPVGYVFHNLLLDIRQSGISGLLHRTPLASTASGAEWNGSLWTLHYEFACYLGLVLLGVLGWRRRPWLVAVVAVIGYLALLGLDAHPSAFDWSLGPFAAAWIVQFGFLFSAAATLATYSARVPLDDRLGALACLAVVLLMPTGAWIPLGCPALVYAVLWLAARLPARHWDRRVDLSYGTYIYAFPLQMLLADYGLHHHGPVLFIAVSLLVSSVAALLSWQLVERFALRWKDARTQREPVPV